MEIYGKSLILIVFIILFLLSIEIFFYKFNNDTKKMKEYFQEEIIITNISKMIPVKGDSSTIVNLEGTGINNIGNIIFKNEIEDDNNNNVAECVILNDRDDTQLKFIPPSATELGIQINQIREKMKENQGFEVSIYFIRQDQKSIEKRIPVKVQNISFFYIDKIPYTNNCPTIKIKEPTITTNDLVANAPAGPIEYKEGSDLEFTNVILKNKEKKIDELIKKLKLILNKNIHLYENQSVDFMETIQALDFLEKYKKNNNSHRYNLHKTINDRYNYNINY